MPELRKDPITDRWVIIATDRARRPADFAREPITSLGGRFCPFCPGNESKTPPEVLAYRDQGGSNGSGWHLRVVPNKFPVLGIEGDLDREGEGLFDKMQGIGAHEVIIETPGHSESMATLEERQVERVLWAFRDRMLDLKKDGRLRYILLFKNQGEPAGASLEHPHSQLIALPVVPKRVQEEIDGAKNYYDFKERCVFCDILRQEAKAATRVVMETDRFLVIEPYAARFPFETWIVPRRHQAHFFEADAQQLQNLAWVLKSTLRKIEKVLEKPPLNFIVHTAPLQEGAMLHYHWHIEIIPRLTRVAGFEWGTGFYINPTPPEESAQFLREAGLG
ncbi:MAG TPA: galactose-1-phosphate uridylyltransferase [Solibacterales bacterium]|nr:galactose-1-phosphate uridylyltransferase [Bryobacterales bacterium]